MIQMTPYELQTFKRVTETMHNTRGLRKLIPIQRRDDDTVIMIPAGPSPPKRYWEFHAVTRRMVSYRNQGVNYA